MQPTSVQINDLASKLFLIPGMEHVFREALARADWAPALECCRRYRVDDLVFGPLGPDDVPNAIGLISRWEFFANISGWLKDDEYFRLLGRVWVEVEKYADPAIAETLFRPQKRDLTKAMLCMNDDERHVLSALPSTLVVYRGCTRDAAEMCSWTLDPDVARHFASVPATVILANSSEDQTPVILVGTCQKSALLAVFTRWGEAEVVVLPRELPDRHEIWAGSPPAF